MTDLSTGIEEGESRTAMKDGFAETVWRGRINKAVMERALADIHELLTANKVDYWLADTSAVASYSADIRAPATDLLRALKQHGVKEVVSIVPSGAVRMLSAALAIAVGFKLKMVPTRNDALAYLRSVKQ